jgi:hypothetical protein
VAENSYSQRRTAVRREREAINCRSVQTGPGIFNICSGGQPHSRASAAKSNTCHALALAIYVVVTVGTAWVTFFVYSPGRRKVVKHSGPARRKTTWSKNSLKADVICAFAACELQKKEWNVE